MKSVKQIRQKLKEFYICGLSKDQKILAIVAFILIGIVGSLWLFNALFNHKKNQKANTANSSLDSKADKAGEESFTYQIKNINSDSGKADSPYPAFLTPRLAEDNLNTNSVDIPLPPIPNYNNQHQESASPNSPIDGLISKIKQDYEYDPGYPLIKDYLITLKNIGDGKKAWNDFYRNKSVELLGKKRALEIETELNKINGNKEKKIKQSHYSTLDDLLDAIRKNISQYIDKSAIEMFLNYVKETSEDKHPWTEATKGLGEIQLEKAWIEQIDSKIRPLKEGKERKFKSVAYKSLEDVIVAIKEDTKNFSQTYAREMFLGRVEELSKKKSLNEEDIGGGGNLFDDYHLEAIKKFANK